MIPIPPGLSEVVRGGQGALLAVSPRLAALHSFIKPPLSPAPWSAHPGSERPSKPDGEQTHGTVTAVPVKQGEEAGREVPFQSTGKASPAPDRWSFAQTLQGGTSRWRCFSLGCCIQGWILLPDFPGGISQGQVTSGHCPRGCYSPSLGDRPGPGWMARTRSDSELVPMAHADPLVPFPSHPPPCLWVKPSSAAQCCLAGVNP